METWELTEYERSREPQEITVDANMTNSLRPLYREIICPICNNILQRTVAARDCLHRFCNPCIVNVLKNSKKECPVCRKKLSSRPSIIEDNNFDLLIQKIYTNAENLNHQQNRSLILPECEVILRPLREKKTRYIKCPDLTTIDHLTKYLSMRPEGSKDLESDLNQEYYICILQDQSQGQYHIFSGEDNLRDIKKRYQTDTSKPIELYFTTKK